MKISCVLHWTRLTRGRKPRLSRWGCAPCLNVKHGGGCAPWKGRFQIWLPRGDADHEAGSGRHVRLALLFCWARDCSSFGDTLGRRGHRSRASTGCRRARLGWAVLGSRTPTAKTSDSRTCSLRRGSLFHKATSTGSQGDRLGRCRDHCQRPDIGGRGVVIRWRGRHGCWRVRRGVRCEVGQVVNGGPWQASTALPGHLAEWSRRYPSKKQRHAFSERLGRHL